MIRTREREGRAHGAPGELREEEEKIEKVPLPPLEADESGFFTFPSSLCVLNVKEKRKEKRWRGTFGYAHIIFYY